MTIKDVIRGDNREVTVNFLQADGSAYNLSGATVTFTVSKHSDPKTDDNPVIQLVQNSFDTPASGSVTFALEPEDTDIKPGTYYYDAQMVDATGVVLSVVPDKFIVIADITRNVQTS